MSQIIYSCCDIYGSAIIVRNLNFRKEVGISKRNHHASYLKYIKHKYKKVNFSEKLASNRSCEDDSILFEYFNYLSIIKGLHYVSRISSSKSCSGRKNANSSNSKNSVENLQCTYCA